MKELFSIKRNLLGKGSVVFKWDPTCKYLACCGQTRRVFIFERNGEQLAEIPLNGPRPVLALDWDKDGDNLAILQEGASVIPIFNMVEKRIKSLETNLKDPSFLLWSKVGPQLAVGTQKGNLLIFNHVTQKKYPVLARHTKRITCGAWNIDNKLALASQDKSMSVSDENGNLLEQTPLKQDPYDLQFAEQKLDDSSVRENTVSINMGHQTILLYNLADTENPFELAFQVKYGDIASYRWFGDGYMLVGFSKGYVIVISTHVKEIGEELQCLKAHDETLYDVVYNEALQRIASVGSDGLRIIDAKDFKELKSEFVPLRRDEGEAEKLQWTKDGQILTVSTNGGNVINFLTSIPVLSNFSGSRQIYLSSLRTISVIDHAHPVPPISIDVAVEPSFVAVGPSHAAVGMNNHCWFYNCQHGNTEIVCERQYLSSVEQLFLSQVYAVALCDGKAYLHPIVPSNEQHDRELKIFPDKPGARITFVGLTNDFLVYCTDRGSLHHFSLADWDYANEYTHDCRLEACYPSHSATRVVFFDFENRGYLYCPVDDHREEIPKLSTSAEGVLWDLTDPDVFIVIDTKLHRNLYTYVFVPQTIKGPQLIKVATTKVQFGFLSVMFHDGQVHGQKEQSGALFSQPLASHDAIVSQGRKTPEKQRLALGQLLQLHRLKATWLMALEVRSRDMFVQLGRRALEMLDVDLALRVYRELKDVAMVLAIMKIQHIEDRLLLSGHVSLLLGDYQRAQTMFLNSSRPKEALQMRRDLLHWEHALKLSAELDPVQTPEICKEYAQQLEIKGEWKQALQLYTQALQEPAELHSQDYLSSTRKDEEKQRERAKKKPWLKVTKSAGLTPAHVATVQGGIARMSIRMGDLLKGRQMAIETGDKVVMRECAAILESMKQLNEAADLYVRSEQYEKAAAIYNAMKNYAKAAPLMAKITTPKIHLQYAKAKEAERQYAEAAEAYERAKDLDSVIRLQLQHLDNPQKAFSIVRATRSTEGAAMVARYCSSVGNYEAAIEFLLMAKRPEEAFALAQKHNEMERYAAALGDEGVTQDYLAIGQHYETVKDYARAGHYYSLCGDFGKAVRLMLMVGEGKLDEAIAVVKKAQGTPEASALARQVHAFISGDVDGKAKDQRYAFRLYMATGDYLQAASSAVAIAETEQKLGNYGDAHAILFETHQDLVQHSMTIPNELKRNLLLLHSYILVKRLVKLGDHSSAARLLIRVAQSISKFPAHVVPILTSTVIECSRADLKRSAYEYATVLMRPEYRKKVDPKYARKIEGIVRRPQSGEEEERLSPCPYCDFELPETLLDCPSCHNALPFCISTGRHMVADDWCHCPSCNFPSLYSVFTERIRNDKSCDMCKQVVDPSAIVKVTNAKEVLLKSSMDFKEPDLDKLPSEEDPEEEKENDEDGSSSPPKPRAMFGDDAPVAPMRAF